MKIIFKALLMVFALYLISPDALGAWTVEEFKACKAECYEQHARCLAECNELLQQHKRLGKNAPKKFSYQQCRYNLENKKCMPALNDCVISKCHPNFKA